MASSTILIEEQSGDRQTLTLVGGGLPKQGAGWEESTNIATTWNPGNTTATQQVLGPELSPSAWDFEWRTTWLTRTPALFNGQRVTRAKSLVDVMLGFKRRAQLVKVTWISGSIQGQAPDRLTRVGRISKVTFNPDRMDDIMAKVEFTWTGELDQQMRASDLRSEGDLNTRLIAIASSDAAAKALLDAQLRRREAAIPNSADQFTLGKLERLVASPLKLADDFARAANSMSSRVQDLGDIIQKARATPYAIANRALDVANQGVAVANQFIDAMSREPPEAMANRSKVSTLMQTASYYSTGVTQADLMSGAYLSLSMQARKRRSSLVTSAGNTRRDDRTRNADNFQIHIPRQGETYASIANKYYGSADLGDELATANGQPSYTITPWRRPIIIPVRRALEDNNRERV